MEPNDVELLLAGLQVGSIHELRQLIDYARMGLGYDPIVPPPAGTFTFDSIAEIALVRSQLRRFIARTEAGFSKRTAVHLLDRLEALA